MTPTPRLRLNTFGLGLAALAGSLALSPTLQAQNREVSLEWLRNAGSVWDGQGSPQYAGRQVSAAGDVNGDGFGDFLVSAWQDGFFDPAGKVYLVYGASFGLPELEDLADADVVLSANEMGDRAGSALGAAGDVNGDGYDDFLIGVPYSDSPAFDTGNVYLVYGDASLPASINLAAAASGTVTRFLGEASGDTFGAAVAGIGDANGDGTPDFLIGATGHDPSAVNLAGRTYLVYGSNSFGDTESIGSLVSGEVVKIDGIAASDLSGARVEAAGDFNNDGYADALIGAEQANPNSKADSGNAYVVYGGSSLPDVIALASLGSAGVTLNGERAGDRLGGDVAGGGDVNNDGYDDILLGADQWDVVGGVQTDDGRAYLVYGGASIANTIDIGSLGAGGVTFTGGNSDDEAGGFVAMGGDMNRDGYADLLIGAQNADPNGGNSGEAYLVHGSPALPTSVALDALGELGVAYGGTGPGVRAGSEVAFLGDLNGSNFDNFAISSRFASSNTGQVAVIDGSCSVLVAEGAMAEGTVPVMKVHGTPFVPFVLFYDAFVQTTPFESSKGPFWMLPSARMFPVLNFDAKGERTIPLPIAPGHGFNGLSIYWQKFEQPSGFGCDLGQVLRTTLL
ncbi:MAG: hypothetical protein DHS20C15_09310 [Planctomycetota bacterium]|nr:MAG: hypothetical protein DHS20C15_09310 [Planctomycetota bacterium]